ncbi:MAG: hypothetical protein R3E64_09535 [Halioglobus sp.]
MENVELSALAELSLTLIGFSAIIAIVQGGPIDQWPPRVRNALWLVVTAAFAALVLCFVPMALRGIGIPAHPIGSIILLLYVLFGFGISMKRSHEYSAAGHAPPSKASWILGGSIASSNVAFQILSLLGFGNPEELYNLGIALIIFTAMIPLMVIISMGKAGSDG